MSDADARARYIAAVVAQAPPISALSAEQIAAVRRLFRDAPDATQTTDTAPAVPAAAA